MLTMEQIQAFTAKAKAAGFNDAQIGAEIARKQAEAAQTQVQPEPTPTAPIMDQPTTTQPPTTTTPTTQPEQQGNFVSNFFKGLAAPAIQFGKYVGEAAGQAGREIVSGRERDALYQKAQTVGLNAQERARLSELTKPMLYSDEELQSKLGTPGGIVKEGLKSAAGAASYLVPGGAGAKLGLTGVKAGIASGIAQGGGSAFLSSISAQEDKDIAQAVKDVGWDTINGILLGGAFSSVGPAIRGVSGKVGKYLTGKGVDVQLSTYVKKMGAKPIQKFGGNKLLQDMKNLRFKAGDAESVIKQADEVLNTNGDIIGSVSEEMSRRGNRINIKPMLDELQTKLKSTQLPGDKTKIQNVIDEIKGAIGEETQIDPTAFYRLKQAIGGKGKWSSNADPDTIFQAQTWRDAYVKANDLFDGALKKEGFSDFRKVNNSLHTAMNAKAWAENVANKAPNVNTFGLFDMLAGVGGGLGAGPAGAVGGVFLRKALNSAVASKAAGGTMKGLGAGIKKAGKITVPKRLQEIITKGTAIGAAGMTTGAETPQAEAAGRLPTGGMPTDTMTTTTGTTQTPKGGPDLSMVGGLTKQQMLAKASAMGATTDDLKEIAERYDLLIPQAEVQAKDLTEGDKSFVDLSYLVDDAITLLETGGESIKTGLLSAPIESAKAKVSKADPDTLEFNTLTSNIRGIITKARGGTALSAQELRMLNTYTPKAGDSRQELENKLAGLKNYLDRKMKTIGYRK